MTTTITTPHIAIFGAGAIGTYLAARLALGGQRVTLVARPATAAQLQGRPLVLTEGGIRHEVPPIDVLPSGNSTEDIDLLLITAKSHQLLAALPELARLTGPATRTVWLQNGIPWWYFQDLPGPWLNRPLHALDPEGALPAAFAPQRVIGGVAYKSADLLAPGQVTAPAAAGDRFVFGTPTGQADAGLQALLAAFADAGIAAEARSDLRTEVWNKLLGNAAFNPLSAIARADMAAIHQFAPTRALVLEVMREVAAVAAAHGITLPQTPEQRLERSQAVGAARTSMLQDATQGRPLEVQGIAGTVLELAELAQVATPRLATLYAATALLSRQLVSSATSLT
jgi:2-dehydropantoate 2-reductase